MSRLVFRSALLDLLRQRREEIARDITARLTAQEAAPGREGAITPERVEQMVLACFPLVAEALEGGSEIRDMYLDTIVPGIVSGGTAHHELLHGNYRAWMYIMADLIARLPAEYRGSAGLWLADFIADWSRVLQARALELDALPGSG